MFDFVKSITVEFWETLADMSPYLLFGFLVAGFLSVCISQKTVERHLGGRGIWPRVKASLLGVPLPLCSCGVIPVSMSLFKHGASRGATISFLLSTPQTGVDSILVTLSLLGPIFAVFRPFVAFATGLIGGTLVDLLAMDRPTDRTDRETCQDDCCALVKHSRTRRAFRYGFVALPRDIGKAMLIGLFIAAILSAIVPNDYFAGKLAHPFLAMVLMLFLGIPVYVCATASVPVAAVLIMKGLTPGAALVFLMTGPATNAASLVTIWKVLGRRTAVAYLATVAGCALASGMLLDYAARGFDFEVFVRPGWMLPDTIKYASAVILLAVLAFAIISKHRSGEKE